MHGYMVIDGVEKHVFPLTGFYKGILHRFWHMHGFINLKTFVHVHTFKMKSAKSLFSNFI